jgi:hypothetical protein
VSKGRAAAQATASGAIADDAGLSKTIEAEMRDLEKAGLCEVTLVTER